MAKLKGKAKAAFLRRMARGRAKARRGGGGGRPATRRTRTKTVRRRKATFSGTLRQSRKHPGVVRIRVRENPMSALIANPGGALVAYDPRFAASQVERYRRRKRKRGPSMAKKKRRKTTRRAAPRRRRRGAARRIRRAIRVPKRYARRVYRPRGRKPVYLNGRRRIRRRRNGSTGSLLKRVLVPYAAGFLASGAVAVLDTALSKQPVVKHIVKVGAAFAIAFFGRRYPVAATAAIATLAASQGYALGLKMSGGFIAETPAKAIEGLGGMAGTYPEIGALLNGGVGALLNGMGGVENPQRVVDNYASAMNNMANQDDD